MTNKSKDSFRGTPPNLDQLADRLKENLPRWNTVRETVGEIGATWRWVFSDATEKWSLRSYLPGDRFFAALTLVDVGFEVSLNLKSEEWETVMLDTPFERTKLAGLRDKALESGDDPAWIHVPVNSDADLALLTKILVARARRVQKPRHKSSKKK